MGKTLVIGASENPQRYSNMAMKLLQKYKEPTVAVGRRIGKVEEVEIHTTLEAFEDVETITLYVGPKNQEHYFDYITSLKPKRVIFNPGTENPVLQEHLDHAGIAYEEACTLVLLNSGQYAI